jgi:uncharacterized membrane protein
MWDWLSGGCCGAGGVLLWATDPLWLAGAALVLAAVWVLALLLPRQAGPALSNRVAELTTLALGLGLVLWMLSGATWVQEGERREKGRFVVLVDGSRSMAVTGELGPRSQAVADILKQMPDAEIFHFGDALRSGVPTNFDAPDSDLGGALSSLSQRFAGERLEGLAILTDGIDRSGLRRRLKSEVDAPIPRIGGPVTVYQIGERGERVDVSVRAVRSGGFAFIHTPFHIDVDVEAHGWNGNSLPVSLSRDGHPEGTRTVILDKDGLGTVRFEVNADQDGRYIYEATVPVVSGDAIPANNSAALAVRMVRDRVRVLQVCGAPSWDQKYLRLFLKEDPGVDLISFFILRTNADMGSGYMPEELSLIEFPYEQLFQEELKSFDLVILQNFDYQPYFHGKATVLLQNIADYVRAGGALVMLGGDRSFDLGSYAGTPIAEVLPVRLGVPGDPVDLLEFRPNLTAVGARHPITQLAPEPADNQTAWSRLASFYGVNLSLGAAEGAAVLLEHPQLKDAAGKPLPVLAVGAYGSGRSMALMGDSSWRWFSGEAGEGRGNQAYLRFWKNAMRWLMGDPQDRPVTVELARENYQQGETVRIIVRTRDVAAGPLANSSVKATVEGPDGSRSLTASTREDGVAVLELSAGRRGAWRVRVEATDAAGNTLGEARSAWAVTNRDPELDEVEPDADFLQKLAERTSGLYVPPGAFQEPLRDPLSGRTVRDRKETPLGTAPLVPLLAGIFLSTSWWLRRKGGYR